MARDLTFDGFGRVTIPREVRKRHHLDEGSRVALVEKKNRIVLIPENQAQEAAPKVDARDPAHSFIEAAREIGGSGYSEGAARAEEDLYGPIKT